MISEMVFAKKKLCKMECDDVMSIWYSYSKVCLSFSVHFVALAGSTVP